MVYQYSARSTNIVVKPFSPMVEGLTRDRDYKIQGYGEDEFLTITLEDDDFTTTSGADGLVVRSFNPNPVATATLTLQQTSESNFIFEQLRQSDRLILGSGMFNLSVVVPIVKSGLANVGLGASTTVSAIAWVEKQADYSFGKESGERAWTLKLANPQYEGSLAAQLANIGATVFNAGVSIANTVNVI